MTAQETLLRGALDAVRYESVFGRAVPTNLELTPLADDAYSVRMQTGSRDLARLLSSRLGGQWFPGAGAVTWRNGSRSVWLILPESVERVERCRTVVTRLTGEPAPWTVGGCGRRLLKWIGPAKRYSATCEYLRADGDWGFRHVSPGRYPSATLYDLTGAYGQLLAALPSPEVSVGAKRLHWHPLVGERRERWHAVLCAVMGEKPLRNTLVGAMLGRSGEGERWIKGERVPWRGAHGPYRAAALLIVRTCYELTGLQVQATPTHYANTDCVMVERGVRPEVWESYRLQYRVLGDGEAHVQAIGLYRCGDYQTKSYRRGVDLRSAAWTTPMPAVMRVRQWL